MVAWNEVMKPLGYKRSMTSYNLKMIFRIFKPSKSFVGIQKSSKRVLLVTSNTPDIEILI